MRYNLHYSPDSISDLDEVWDYIAIDLDNVIAANRMVTLITDSINKLESFAEMGSLLSSVIDFISDYRFLICDSYLVFYRVICQDIYIDRVIYGKRDYLRILFGMDIHNNPYISN